MVTKKFSSLGLVVALHVPATVEEFDQLAGKTGACLDSAINNEVYRGSLAEFRDTLIHGRDEEKDEAGNVIRAKFVGLEERFDVPRLTKKTGKQKEVKVKGADGVETTTKVDIETWGESEADYLKRLCALKGWNDDATVEKELQPIADELSSSIVFDPSQAERKPAGPKKLAKMYREAAENIFKNGNQGTWVTKLQTENGITLSFEDEPATDDANFATVRSNNIDKLGWAIKAREDAKAKERVGEYV